MALGRVWVLVLVLTGCVAKDPGNDHGGAGAAGAGGAVCMPGQLCWDAGNPFQNPMTQDAAVGDGGSTPVKPLRADKADILFVIDNSGSMQQEQVALRAQFPGLMRALTSGDADQDGTAEFRPITDLHLGVISTDMGLVNVTGVPNCDGFGDDGVLLHAPATDVAGCAPSYPAFLTFMTGQNEPDQFANDFACIATLGTEGCGFEQPLEAMLKALWPATDVDLDTGMVHQPNRIQFLTQQGTTVGATGHGDEANLGFLRSDPTQGASLIAVVLVTDEEDCSSLNTRHFLPANLLDPTDPLAMQDLNLRCFFNPQNLYDVQRYVDGLRALRPGQEQHVMFAAIAGVPPDLVDAQALSGVNFADDASREAFYTKVLTDPRMVETPDPTLDPGSGNLMSSCTADVDGDGMPESKAYPPRRIVEVARRFGANGFVQSICQADFGPAMTAIIRRLAFRFGAP